MKRWLLLAACCLAAVGRAGAWGQKGHDVTACIAEAHLTPEAAERIERILGGRSMVYEANWMDQGAIPRPMPPRSRGITSTSTTAARPRRSPATPRATCCAP